METNNRRDFSDVIQAMLGAVTPNWRAVFVKHENATLRVTVVLEHDSAEDREEIDDVTFELCALQLDPLQDKVEMAAVVNTSSLAAFVDAGQMVFARKEKCPAHTN